MIEVGLQLLYNAPVGDRAGVGNEMSTKDEPRIFTDVGTEPRLRTTRPVSSAQSSTILPLVSVYRELQAKFLALKFPRTSTGRERNPSTTTLNSNREFWSSARVRLGES